MNTLIDDNQKVEEKNRKNKNYIRELKGKKVLEKHFDLMEWDYFITITFETPKNKSTAFDLISSFYNQLESAYPTKLIRMLFTTEEFTNRCGVHNHLALRLSENATEIKTLLSQISDIGIVDIKDYDSEQAGVFYIAKEGLKELSWDILGNRLDVDGDRVSEIQKIIVADKSPNRG